MPPNTESLKVGLGAENNKIVILLEARKSGLGGKIDGRLDTQLETKLLCSWYSVTLAHNNILQTRYYTYSTT